MRKVAERLGVSVEDAAVSVIRMVDASMINALKLVSVQRGHDPREFALVVGGGGGAMHAAQLSRELGVKEVIVPLYPGLFSAWGMLATEQRRDFVRSQLSLVRETGMDAIKSVFSELNSEAFSYFSEDKSTTPEDISFIVSCDMRYFGQEHAVTVPVELDVTSIEDMLRDFHNLHEKAYTFQLSDTDVELVTYRLTAQARAPVPQIKPLTSDGRSVETARKADRKVNFGEDGCHIAAIYDRAMLPPDFEASGPIVIEEATSTTIVLPGQRVLVDKFGFLRITQENKA